MIPQPPRPPRLHTGLVLGKLLPPHLGHLYLIGCALRQVERLYVVVEHIAGEDLPSARRIAWLQALVPTAHILHLDRAMPQTPAAHPRFWPLWRATLQALLPEPIEAVFASEPYGHRLAAELCARFLPVDPGRTAFPISGTAVRADPAAHAAHLPDPVRAYYRLPPRPPPPPARRIALVGPESTGKSTLARALAAALGGAVVPEHAQTCIDAGVADPAALTPRDFEDFARGQRASEDTLAALRGGLLLCDSDALTTQLYAERILGHCPAWITAEACTRAYPLTLLTPPDGPWQPAPHRIDPTGRATFFTALRARLDALGRPYRLLDADPDRRLLQALAALRAG